LSSHRGQSRYFFFSFCTKNLLDKISFFSTMFNLQCRGQCYDHNFRRNNCTFVFLKTTVIFS
jgi:hypothetical protein